MQSQLQTTSCCHSFLFLTDPTLIFWTSRRPSMTRCKIIRTYEKNIMTIVYLLFEFVLFLFRIHTHFHSVFNLHVQFQHQPRTLGRHQWPEPARPAGPAHLHRVPEPRPKQWSEWPLWWTQRRPETNTEGASGLHPSSRP